ncbi:MAG: FAD-dependent oxidoreductase [Clostridia bacterium]|nr:FAD-dependent oxidoreductase [Clostridia bacterium]
MNSNLKNVNHKADLCVVGGGLAGMCAAVAAARHGISVVLMHDRPVFGGNASSEIRMWVCGAHGENNRETGIIEEIALETLYRNPHRLYPIWDSILYELIKNEKNITPVMNCSCNDVEMDGNRIKKVIGWQTTSQLWHTVEADYFADCSGDSILAPLTGAEFRLGRESRDEFGESIAPEASDKKTMGLSCLMQARQMTEARSFIPPSWARKFTKKDLPFRLPDMNNTYENFWYMELGGENDSIHETEEIRDELLKVAYGIWDYVKNSGECDADNWELDFVGFLPGKRESRRYVGDYIMTQNDVRSEGRFDDLIAYGGWTMDDHNPGGINTLEPPNIFHDAPSPFGIPYRCLYSVNIDNLFFAGRNISVTHCAMSSTRVMATCALLGQAVGTAAAIASANKISPRDVYKEHINELKQTLMDDDCYLPFNKKEASEITKKAEITTTGENADLLINGIERPVGGKDNCWLGGVGDSIVFTLPELTEINEIRFVFDSDLNRETTGDKGFLDGKMNMCNIPLNAPALCVPKTLVKNLEIELQNENGEWIPAEGIKNNHQRLVKLHLGKKARGVKITVTGTNGNEKVGIYSVDIR